ncbi:HEAT repeat domain-containing protein [Planctomyces sp. SH-PL62]|uniref:HEAT repeat domain-containing protein n=1 Tax=Planctomyces sp. SH-PL62 TaxID=1636152 RepID=UPI0018D3EB56|nr:HEAT repeat domain-containing protein [Planctomyces sp. SH-PL62]
MVKSTGHPSYAGRNLQSWTLQLDDPDPARRLAAIKALGAIGPGAAPSVPELTRALSDRESWIRCEAAVSLGKVGPAAAGSAQAMFDAMRRADGFQPGLIAGAIAQLGPSVVPLLVEATRERPGSVRRESIHALGLMGPEARGALGRIEELTHDHDVSTRIQAASVLWSISGRPDAASILIEALADRTEFVRGQAAFHLGLMGPAAESAVSALIRLLEGENPADHESALNALGRIGPPSVAAVPAMLRRSTAASPAMLPWAVSLASIGPGAVPALIEGLDDPVDGIRWTAAAALGRIGPKAGVAVPKLSRMSTSARAADRVVAALACWRIAQDRRIIPVLLSSAGMTDPRDLALRYAALDALAEIGPSAAEAVPTLSQQLSAENDSALYKVVRVLGRIGPAAAEAVEPLQRISAHSGEDMLRAHANEAIWRITGGEKGIEALVKELQGGSEYARSSALGALSPMGPGAAAAAPAIAEVLRRDPSDGLAAAVLRNIGPPARSTLPILIEVFKGDLPLDKSEVAAAIRAIDPETAKSLGIR